MVKKGVYICMNRQFLMVGLLFILIMPQAWGATSAYPDPNRVTVWNKLNYGIKTLGQSPQQAKITELKLRHATASNRIKSINKAAKAKRLAQMKAWQNNQNIP